MFHTSLLYTTIFCGLFLTAHTNAKALPIQLTEELQVLKQTQLEPIVPKLLAMEQQNKKRYTSLQNDALRCLNPKFPMDYE